MASARKIRGRGASGLSLVEILMALSIGVAIATAGMSLAQVLGQVHQDQTQLQSLTDNLRGALMQINLDARLAGAGMASTDATNAATPTPALVPAVSVTNSSTGPDQLDLLSIPGTAVATTMTATTPAATQILVDLTGGAAFATGDYMLLTNMTSSVLYQLTGTGTSTVGSIAVRSLLVPGAPAFPVAQYDPGSLVLRASVVRYSVGLGSAIGMPTTSVLMVTDGAPLNIAGTVSLAAENVFDLQIAVGVDGINGQATDGIIREVGLAANDDEWIFNVAGEALPGAPVNMRALRITLVGRTSMIGAQPGTGRPAAEDRAAGAPDFFRWRLQREVVMLRNMVLR